MPKQPQTDGDRVSQSREHAQVHARQRLGWRWQGDPDRGYGKGQPGGWAYNILAFMEEAPLRDAGRGITNLAQKQAAMLAAVSTPVPVFNCPTRRPALAYPLSAKRHANLANNLPNCVSPNCVMARTDYRVNGGNANYGGDNGPASEADAVDFPWFSENPRRRQFGISFQRSEIRMAQITDGTSKTAMVGEKYLNPDRYIDGDDSADDQNIFVGHDRDVIGYTYFITLLNPTGGFTFVESQQVSGTPLQDRPGYEPPQPYRFGSAHPAGIHMAFCDGSVQTIPYDVEMKVFALMGGRDDGMLP